jgi:RNA recognition motif-containing protein
MANSPPPAKRPRTAPAQIHVRAAARPSKAAAIAERLAFWFSAANLRKSTFLGPLMRADLSGKGWVPVSDLLTFNSLIDLSASADDVLEAAHSLPDLLEADAHSKRVRLVGGLTVLDAALDPALQQEVDERTLFLAPLPFSVTRSQILSALAGCGKVLFVSIPHIPETGLGKGFAFVEFDSAADARACITAVDTGKGPLVRRFKRVTAVTRTAWKASKQEQHAQRLLLQEEKKQKRFDWERKRQLEIEVEERKHTADACVVDKLGTRWSSVARMKRESNDVNVPVVSARNFEPDVIVRATGFPLPTTRTVLRDLFTTLGGPVAYVDYRTTVPDSVYVRFNNSASAATAVATAQSPLNVAIVSGFQESTYWDELHARSREKHVRTSRRESLRCQLGHGETEAGVPETISAPVRVHVKFDVDSDD